LAERNLRLVINNISSFPVLRFAGNRFPAAFLPSPHGAKIQKSIALLHAFTYGSNDFKQSLGCMQTCTMQ